MGGAQTRHVIIVFSFGKMVTRRGRGGVDELAPFVLTNVEGLKKDSEEAGHGAYVELRRNQMQQKVGAMQGGYLLAVQGQPGYQTNMDPSQYQTQGGGVVSINERGFRSGNFEELRRNQQSPSSSHGEGSMPLLF